MSPPVGPGIGVRLRALFVAPAAASAPDAIRVGAPHPSVAVLGSGADAAALGAAVGIALARAGRAPCALVMSWSAQGEPVGGWTVPAALGARRLAARLADRGHNAMATGRLACVALPVEESAAAIEAQRVLAAADGVPTVLTVAGPRGAGVSALVGGQDHVLVFAAPDAPPGLTDLALNGLPAGRASAHVVAAGRVARALAQAGVAVAPGLRAPMLTAAAGDWMTRARGESGQALLVLVGVLLTIVVGALVLGAVAQGVAGQGDRQRAADLGALAAARVMHDAYGRLFEPVLLGDDEPNPRHLERAAFLRLARGAAVRTAQANGVRDVVVAFPDADPIAPVRIRVTVNDPLRVGPRATAPLTVRAEAELVPPGGGIPGGVGAAGEYRGPFAKRQGKLMRPDVAQAFDRLYARAREGGIALVVVGAFRSDAEQASLFAGHPDPRWVARPGTSLHRLGTELDLGPASAYPWLAAHAPRLGFIKRYAWEPWHFGFANNAASTGSTTASDGRRHRAMPGFVPAGLAPAISRAAQRWNVSAALLAAQLYVESGFNPFARSPVGAQGIAQFMPATAQRYGLGNPYDVTDAIGAQAHLMRDLLRRFASVPLALAAYNAGEGAVARCNCSHPYPETAAYVAKILGLMGGAGDPGGGTGGLEIRLVR